MEKENKYKEIKLLVQWPRGFSFLPCQKCMNYLDGGCMLSQDYPEGYIASDNTGRRCEMGRGCWHFKSDYGKSSTTKSS